MDKSEVTSAPHYVIWAVYSLCLYQHKLAQVNKVEWFLHVSVRMRPVISWLRNPLQTTEWILPSVCHKEDGSHEIGFQQVKPITVKTLPLTVCPVCHKRRSLQSCDLSWRHVLFEDSDLRGCGPYHSYEALSGKDTM